jgi:hypothetical protein
VYNLLRDNLFTKGYAGRVLVGAPEVKYQPYLNGVVAAALADPVGKKAVEDGRLMITIDMEVRAWSATGGEAALGGGGCLMQKEEDEIAGCGGRGLEGAAPS